MPAKPLIDRLRRLAAGLACVVAVDTGHHAEDPGATSARGVAEHAYNRALADTVTATLTADGVAVIPTNPSGARIGLYDRLPVPNNQQADLLISLHHDSTHESNLEYWLYDDEIRHYSDEESGFSLFVSAKNPRYLESLAIARDIAAALRRQGLRPTLHHAGVRPLIDADSGIYRFDDLVVLKTARMPAVLVEGGVIVNRDEELMIASPGHREIFARALRDAVKSLCRTNLGAADRQR